MHVSASKKISDWKKTKILSVILAFQRHHGLRPELTSVHVRPISYEDESKPDTTALSARMRDFLLRSGLESGQVK